jgi:hypothetical protein
MTLIEIDQDLIIFRTNQGIKLIKPAGVDEELKLQMSFNTGHTIASLSSLPFNFISSI